MVFHFFLNYKPKTKRQYQHKLILRVVDCVLLWYISNNYFIQHLLSYIFGARGNNDRRLKSQGSSKAVSHYSAYIQETVNVRECVVNVKYNSTHYNHELQLGHLRIATSTRKAIANKLKHGITPKRILDDLREVKHFTRPFVEQKGYK